MVKKKGEKPVSKILEVEQKVRTAMRADVEDLFQLFIKSAMTYDSFVQCFKNSDFWMICFGRLSVPDEYEFTEDFLHYAISFAFPQAMRSKKEKPRKAEPGDEFQEKAEQLFGIFLTYTSFFTQPQTEVRLVRLRVDLAEYIPTIMRQFVLEGQHHALYCLQRLIAAKAFMIVPFDEDHNPLLQRRFNKVQEKPDLDEVVEFARLETVTKCQDVEILSELHTKYEELKRQCGVPKAFQKPGEDISGNLKNILTETIEKYESNLAPVVEKETIFHKVSNIRKKALESDITVPRHRRHKLGVDIDAEGLVFEQQSADKEVNESRKRGRKKVKPDLVQSRARATVIHAHNRALRIRRETEGTEIAASDLVRKEVELDMAAALEKQANRSPRKKRTSTITSDNAETPGPSTVKRRSSRLSKKSVENVQLPTVNVSTTAVTKAALAALEQSQDADFALRKLRSMKK